MWYSQCRVNTPLVLICLLCLPLAHPAALPVNPVCPVSAHLYSLHSRAQPSKCLKYFLLLFVFSSFDSHMLNLLSIAVFAFGTASTFLAKFLESIFPGLINGYFFIVYFPLFIRGFQSSTYATNSKHHTFSFIAADFLKFLTL